MRPEGGLYIHIYGSCLKLFRLVIFLSVYFTCTSRSLVCHFIIVYPTSNCVRDLSTNCTCNLVMLHVIIQIFTKVL